MTASRPTRQTQQIWKDTPNMQLKFQDIGCSAAFVMYYLGEVGVMSVKVCIENHRIVVRISMEFCMSIALLEQIS
jgi:hypothetical protein